MEEAYNTLPLASLEPDDQSLLRILFHLAAQIASERDPQRLKQMIVATIEEAVPGVDCALLWLYDEADDRLHVAAVQGAAGQPQEAIEPLLQVTVRAGEGTVGSALVRGKPVATEDAAAFYRAIAMVNEPTRLVFEHYVSHVAPVCALVAVPLLTGDRRIGVIELLNANGTPPLRDETLTIFQTFAHQIASVLLNSQLYTQLEMQNRRLQAFDAVVTAISGSPDVGQLLHQALLVVLSVFEVERGAITLVDGATGTLQLQVSQQFDSAMAEALRATSVAGSPYDEVIRFGQPLVQPLQRDHPWYDLFQPMANAVALSPLLAGGTVVGVLLLFGQEAMLQQLNWSSLLAIGAQIGFAVANAQLFTASFSERRRLAGVITSIVEGVLICNADGEIVIANEAASTLLHGAVVPGISLEALAASYQFRDVLGNELAIAMTPLGRGLHGEVFQDYDVAVHTSDSRELVLSTSGAPLMAENGVIDGAVVVFRDVTAHKQHDAERDEFLAVGAHELRAPLAAIKGYTDLLVKREMGRPDATERDIRGIVMLSRQVDHLVMLIDNLLDLSRLDAGRLQLALQTIDIMALIDASVERVRAGDNRHAFEVLGPSSLMLVADPLRIQQVLTNLIANAVRYSPANTHITVEASVDSCAFDDYTTGVDGCIVVAVRDQGPGIPEEIQSLIFQRYFRAATVTSTSGLGLGLYLSREIVQRHGGQLRVKSTLGQGATFFIELPVSGPQQG